MEKAKELRHCIDSLLDLMQKEDPEREIWMLKVLYVVANRLFCNSGKSKLFSFNLL